VTGGEVSVGEIRQPSQCFQRVVHIGAEDHLVLLQRLLREGRIGAEEHLSHGYAYLVGRVARQRDDLHLERPDRERAGLHHVVHPTGLGEGELVAQGPNGGCSAVEEDRFHDGMLHHRRLQGGSVGRHPQATLQEVGAAEVVGVGVGEEDRLQGDVHSLDDPQRSPGGVFVQPGVDQQSLAVLHDQAHVDPALQVVDAGCQFDHAHSFVS